MYPIRLQPAYQKYVWGGERIAQIYHRSLPEGKYAESWEVSDRKEGMSYVANGKWKGKSLKEICEKEKEKIVGKNKSWSPFPLLIKIIDAQENLSIQVHPNETNASLLGGEAKSEMWIALRDSEVYGGLKKGTSQEEFLKAIEEKKGETLLEKVALKEGEALFVPGGRVHAICKGSLILEVQQNSNTTYRLYDWGRQGRELHLKEGLLSIDWKSQTPQKMIPSFSQADGHHRLESILHTDYFITERLEIADRWQLKSHQKTCQILFCTQGKAIIENEPLEPGMTYLIPAASTPMSIVGHCELIVVRLD